MGILFFNACTFKFRTSCIPTEVGTVKVQSKEQLFPELVKEIRDLKTLTNEWILIIDAEKWSEIRQMEIIEMISYFRKKNIYQWNQWVREITGNEMSRAERDKILDVRRNRYGISYGQYICVSSSLAF